MKVHLICLQSLQTVRPRALIGSVATLMASRLVTVCGALYCLCGQFGPVVYRKYRRRIIIVSLTIALYRSPTSYFPCACLFQRRRQAIFHYLPADCCGVGKQYPWQQTLRLRRILPATTCVTGVDPNRSLPLCTLEAHSDRTAVFRRRRGDKKLLILK